MTKFVVLPPTLMSSSEFAAIKVPLIKNFNVEQFVGDANMTMISVSRIKSV
jgi:hypothetical protein